MPIYAQSFVNVMGIISTNVQYQQVIKEKKGNFLWGWNNTSSDFTNRRGVDGRRMMRRNIILKKIKLCNPWSGYYFKKWFLALWLLFPGRRCPALTGPGFWSSDEFPNSRVECQSQDLLRATHSLGIRTARYKNKI